ncbi:MAG: 2-C-methyl-D-erythritol 4-phosphate cytidylyltransferase [Nitrospirae bacterium]|nr:MAG: 2-C-methyl-D-erythritol 4-phosphate cytidylyltransferase [Nitrospirota bacterium]
MGADKPKQFLHLGNLPLLVYALRVFEAASEVAEVILVVPQSERAQCEAEVVRAFGLRKVTQIVAGGERRQDSVWKGLQAADPRATMVLVHDAVRPLVTKEMVSTVLAAARQHGAAIVAIPLHDTVKRVKPDRIIERTIPREELWLAQTPQAFEKSLLVKAHRQGQQDGVEATDDAFLVERLGRPVAIVPGSADNIKITRPEDLAIGEALLRRHE